LSFQESVIIDRLMTGIIAPVIMKYKIEKKFIIALIHLPGIKRKTAYKLLVNLDRDILSLGELIEYLSDKGDIKLKSTLSIDGFDNALKLAWQILQQSAANDIKMVSVLDDDYPKFLRQSNDPPIILNYMGDITLLSSKPTIAIIGTRDPSAYGERYSKFVSDFFARKGFNIVSGLAKGCDTAAHLGAINANGVTSAVLAHGLDKVYPKENKALADQIKQCGVLVSEYFIGTQMSRKNFVERDRIQAALSLGTFIVECTIGSGTMHTAKYTKDYDRVLAVMKPPLRDYNETRVSGNQMLSQTGKAVAIYDNYELEELTTYLIKKH